MHEHMSVASEAMADLKLCLTFLKLANKFISLNLLIERQPANIFATESHKYRIGVGRAFRYEVPIHLWLSTSNNVLECSLK